VVQRFEVFTGAGKRRDWPDEVRSAIIAESYSGRETVSSVARRHGLSPSQLFTWRRELRKQLEAQGHAAFPVASLPSVFVPAVIDPPVSEPARVIRRRQSRRAGTVELEIDGVAVKIGHGAEASVIAAVIEALKATR
jgi:transposase